MLYSFWIAPRKEGVFFLCIKYIILQVLCGPLLFMERLSIKKYVLETFHNYSLATSHQKLHDLLMTSSNFSEEKTMRSLGVMGGHKFLTIAGATFMPTIKTVYVYLFINIYIQTAQNV